MRRFVPSQVPTQALPGVPAHGVLPLGAEPVTAVHVPTLVGTVHDSHCPVQSVSQQTLSTQWPVPHSKARVQDVPGGEMVVQVPLPAQNLPAGHCASVAQPVHLVAPQTFGAQAAVVTAGHMPEMPSQTAGSVATPPVQLGARHCTELPGIMHAAGWMPSHVASQPE